MVRKGEFLRRINKNTVHLLFYRYKGVYFYWRMEIIEQSFTYSSHRVLRIGDSLDLAREDVLHRETRNVVPSGEKLPT